MPAEISVVIPTRDSEATLGPCLRSLTSQAFLGLEVIVVDGGSSDRSVEVARQNGASVYLFKGSVPAARNLGFSKSSGRLLLSMDSDMVAEPGLLSDIAVSMGPHGALIIPEAGSGRGFLSRCKSLEKSIYLGDPGVEAARAFTRKAFDAVGGYDPGLRLAEDRDLHWRISRISTIGRTARRFIHSTEGLTLLRDLQKSFIYGKSLPAYLARKDSDSSAWLSFHRTALPKYLSRMREDPLLTLGLLALRGMEYAAGLAGYAFGRLGM
ncbi:glycosyltransferase [Candidatus Micrarchaeota archaeon]|nr:glycosyltransferase [Candidatus Micrarchaeota archaeon]